MGFCTANVPINMRDTDEIERSVATFARVPNGGLVVTPSGPSLLHRKLIITLAARHKLPAVYFERAFAAAGGLASYGADFLDQYRKAANCVDRVLKGEKPADRPVQAPTKYQLVINLKTAKALGFAIPPAVLARARLCAWSPRRRTSDSSWWGQWPEAQRGGPDEIGANEYQ
jgi:ABC transporter substrate binding protein